MLIAGFFAADDRPPPQDLRDRLAGMVAHGGPVRSRLDTGPVLILESADPPAGPEAEVTAIRFDASDGELTLTRGALSTQPLYYRDYAGGLVFASRLGALAALPERPALRPEALHELLELQFGTGRETVYSGVFRLRLGEVLSVRGGRIIGRRRLPAVLEDGITLMTESAATTGFGVHLERAVGERLGGRSASDIVLLSSGAVDGLALAVALRRLTGETIRMRLFAPSPEEERVRHLRQELGRMGVRVECVTITPDLVDALLPQTVAVLDDPAADYFALPMRLLGEGLEPAPARIFSPLGADPLLAGYGRYRRYLRPVLLGGRSVRARGHLEGLGLLRAEDDHWRDGITAVESGLKARALTRLQRVQALDCTDWLANDQMMVQERLVGSVGGGLACPYLDARLARFAFALPDRHKIRGGHGKYVIRRWVERVAPALAPFERQQVRGVPVGPALAARGERLGPLVARSAGLAGLCDPAQVEQLFLRLGSREGRRPRMAAWLLVFLALWHKIHVEGAAPADTIADTLA
ncbi:MAG: hypothetical protein HXY25_11155 [Alphaproteobacteria bacterium]|nr:hypothetical protein [Alphaproteobacteria bacterium]